MREKDLEEEVASLREQLSHLQDEYTQAGVLLLVCVCCVNGAIDRGRVWCSEKYGRGEKCLHNHNEERDIQKRVPQRHSKGRTTHTTLAERHTHQKTRGSSI